MRVPAVTAVPAWLAEESEEDGGANSGLCGGIEPEMTATTHPGRSEIAAELAAVLPRFDPFGPRRDRGTSWVLIVSILFHLALLLIFWDSLIGAVIESEETVLVKMVEEKPKLQRKVLAQRRIDTRVRRFKDIAQPEISKVDPVQVLDQAHKVEVDPTRMTVAPKQITTRKVVTRTVSAFADVPTQVQPLEVDRVEPTVREVSAAKASAGPRQMQAAGPVVTSSAVDVEAPMVAHGEISNQAIAGDLEGARIASLESGTSDRLLRGDGGYSLRPGDKDCMKDPACLEYLEMIRDRVYARWNVGNETKPGVVRLHFRVDRGGSAHDVLIKYADDRILGDTCQLAFRHASPFPPPPREIHYLVNKGIVANFQYGNAP